MSDKQYEALAAALRRSRPEKLLSPKMYAVALAQWRYDVSAIVHALSADDPSFNPGRFGEACGREEVTP